MQNQCLEIAWDSPHYQQALSLRYRLLRKPLGLEFDPAELSDERHQWHFGIADAQDQVIACVVAVPLDGTLAKLRQMVVETAYQGRGLGAQLLSETEQRLIQRGIRSVTLHARESATGFYRRLGYRIEGQPFLEVSLPHYRMLKSLDDPSD